MRETQGESPEMHGWLMRILQCRIPIHQIWSLSRSLVLCRDKLISRRSADMDMHLQTISSTLSSQGKAFDIKASKTAMEIPCGAPLCNCGAPSCECLGKKCHYSRTYGENPPQRALLPLNLWSTPGSQPESTFRSTSGSNTFL